MGRLEADADPEVDDDFWRSTVNLVQKGFNFKPVEPVGLDVDGGLDVDEPEFDRDFWRSVKRHGDLDNIMPLAEAEKLDKQAEERAKNDNFGELPPMKFLLYPDLTEAHDKDIASKLKGLKRDSQIVLPDGTKIPYWQTLQYVNRNMRLFFTRFVESKDDNKEIMDQTDQTIAWEWIMLLRKVLVTDCVKSYIENDPKYPKKKYSGAHMGKKMSGPIFWRHLEADRRAAFLRMGKLKSASAAATGPGITMNNAKMFKERRAIQTIALLAHEIAHNMGYHHKDRAPGGIQNAVMTCAGKRKKAYLYTTVDLAQPAFRDFEVQK